jgi:hypothetical protein
MKGSQLYFQLLAEFRVRVVYRCRFNIPFQMRTFQRALIPNRPEHGIASHYDAPHTRKVGATWNTLTPSQGGRISVPYGARWRPGVRIQEVPVQHTPSDWFKKLFGPEPKDLPTDSICPRFAERL